MEDARGWREGVSYSSEYLSNSNLGESDDEDDDKNKMAKRTDQGINRPLR